MLSGCAFAEHPVSPAKTKTSDHSIVGPGGFDLAQRYEIASLAGLALDGSDGSASTTAAGSRIPPTARWQFVAMRPGLYRIVNTWTGKALEANGTATPILAASGLTTGPGQEWRVVLLRGGPDRFRIINARTHLTLTMARPQSYAVSPAPTITRTQAQSGTQTMVISVTSLLPQCTCHTLGP